MLKTTGVAALVAAGTAFLIVGLQGHPEPGADPALLDMLSARMSDVEARLDTLDQRPTSPTLQGAPAPSPQDLVARLDSIERRMAKIGKPFPTRPKRTSNRVRPTAQRPTNRAPSPPQKKPTADETRRTIDESIEKIRRMPAETRFGALYRKAMDVRSAGLHELEEELFRETIDGLGIDNRVAKEASYQIGWARWGARDYAGAREAWLEARDNFPREHFRFDYARFYAASSAVQSGERDVAERELEDLMRDISRNPERETLANRTRSLLVTLGQ